MTVQQIIDLAKNGELRQLSIADDVVAMLGYLNLGMLELYKRFSLRTEEYIVTLEDGKTIYTLPTDFMWIVSAYGEVPENSVEDYIELPVNKEDDLTSINTISWNKLQIPLTTAGAYVSIIYVAAPVSYTDTDLSVDIDLPPQMYDALLDYIAYRATSSADTGVQSEDSLLYQRFEATCTKLLSRGMMNSDDAFMSNRVKDRGFA